MFGDQQQQKLLFQDDLSFVSFDSDDNEFDDVEVRPITEQFHQIESKDYIFEEKLHDRQVNANDFQSKYRFGEQYQLGQNRSKQNEFAALRKSKPALLSQTKSKGMLFSEQQQQHYYAKQKATSSTLMFETIGDQRQLQGWQEQIQQERKQKPPQSANYGNFAKRQKESVCLVPILQTNRMQSATNLPNSTRKLNGNQVSVQKRNLQMNYFKEQDSKKLMENNNNLNGEAAFSFKNVFTLAQNLAFSPSETLVDDKDYDLGTDAFQKNKLEETSVADRGNNKAKRSSTAKYLSCSVKKDSLVIDNSANLLVSKQKKRTIFKISSNAGNTEATNRIAQQNTNILSPHHRSPSLSGGITEQSVDWENNLKQNNYFQFETLEQDFLPRASTAAPITRKIPVKNNGCLSAHSSSGFAISKGLQMKTSKVQPQLMKSSSNFIGQVSKVDQGQSSQGSEIPMIVNQKRKVPQQSQQPQQLTKTFWMNSQDDYIRRALVKLGWKEIKTSNYSSFELKWIYIDSSDDYKLLQDNQFYNHFKNNTELTSKGRLHYNLKNNSSYGVNPEEFFPRCFDLGSDVEREEFIQEYKRMNVLTVLIKHIEYIKMRRIEMYQKAKQLYKLKQTSKLNDQQHRPIFSKKKDKFHSALIYEEAKRDSRFIVNTSIISHVIEFLKRAKKQDENCLDETNELKDIEDTQKIDSMIAEYAKLNVPFDEDALIFQRISGMTQEFWQTPSIKLITKLYSLYKFVKKTDPQFKVNGTRNVWIIKPTANSRGQGIWLLDKWEEAIDCGMKLQARLVQKYIERPLIFSGEQYGNLNNKKFDIRQWVLVNRLKPLQIYFFQNSYLRICNSDYSTGDIKDLSRHLTNFSVNKQGLKKEQWSETVLELKEFVNMLQKAKGVDYHKDIKPGIKQLIINTLKSTAHGITHRQHSFELYGFDILIDENLKPWLLEVNMSPACSERTQFLTQMLNEMALKMFKIIFEGTEQEIKDEIDLSELKDSEQELLVNTVNNNWEEIFNEEEEDDFQDEIEQNALGFNTDAQLVVIGQKADLKKEKNLDKKFFQYWQQKKYPQKKKEYYFIFVNYPYVLLIKMFFVLLLGQQS